ncbi:MAG: hypothetical protein LBC38_00730 [Oscillospiraceae bacterium]|jgi:hypothetical protein|nr:hypothetical protein [Oscillospiraceae bacterium]
MKDKNPTAFAALLGVESSNVLLSDMLPLLATGSHARIAYCSDESAESAVARAFSEFNDELPKKPHGVALFLTVPAADFTLERAERASVALQKLTEPNTPIVFSINQSLESKKATAVIIAAEFK